MHISVYIKTKILNRFILLFITNVMVRLKVHFTEKNVQKDRIVKETLKITLQKASNSFF